MSVSDREPTPHADTDARLEELAFRMFCEYHGYVSGDVNIDANIRLMFATPRAHGAKPERERWMRVAALRAPSAGSGEALSRKHAAEIAWALRNPQAPFHESKRLRLASMLERYGAR